ncbi:hypothetical protein LTR84_011095 [Exophiala bonariae]|uniref:Zn(2)-C6 fungal-type domain-containing protein n=1 Tax=Exophiala bonariae TaxID=1690606 RepID=A0AAV9NKM8_9EURO|nr:hypothetical protein LTR84_011095 [Exophiala bonariae]
MAHHPITVTLPERRTPSISGSESVKSDDSGESRDTDDHLKVAAFESKRGPSPTRLKRSHNKVRTGCITCRQRRVKCDEAQPTCLRCAKAGRFCEGYTQSRTWLFDPNTGAPHHDLPFAYNTFDTSPIQPFLEEVDISRILKFFIDYTAPHLANYFAEMIDSFVADKTTAMYSAAQAWTFWNKLVIQTSETHPCIRYSIVALGSLHEWNELSRRTPWQNTTFTCNYTKAITEINSSHTPLPVEILLISCILFAHCEYLMGASAAGLVHLKSGYRIISEHKKKQLPLSAEVSDQIEPIMRCLIAKAEYYKLEEEVSTDQSGSEETTYISPEMVHTFRDLTEANKFVEQALYWVLLLDLGQPHYLMSKISVVRKYVNDWATAFGRWKAGQAHDDPELKDWQLLLLSHHRMALLLLRSLPPENDKAYGRAASDFRIMFAQLRTFLRSAHPGLEQPHESRELLNMHLGYIAPLFFIATQCRLSDIRRNALDALKGLKVAEGRWNSCVAYTIAKAVIGIEESLADTSPARLTRVKIESVDRSGDGALSIQYYKVPGRGMPDDSGSLRVDVDCCADEAEMKWVSLTYKSFSDGS